MVSMRLHPLRVYCTPGPHGTKEKGAGGADDGKEATNQTQFPSQTEGPQTTGFQPIEKPPDKEDSRK